MLLRANLALVLIALLAVVAAPAGAGTRVGTAEVYALANGCFTAEGEPAVAGTPLTFKATGLGTFLLLDAAGQLVGVRGDGSVGRVGGPEQASRAAEWAALPIGDKAFALRSSTSDKQLSVRLTPATGCAAFPEAELNATGTPPRPINANGTVTGFVDTHLHITGDMRAGGAVIGGEPFDPFGIIRALGSDAETHGADGSLDPVGNLLRDGVPFGTHDTGGWPRFAGWPTHGTNTHEQVYYRWLERARLAGLRIVVAQVIEDAIICKIQPRRRYSCDETKAIAGQIRRLRALRDYVDAQHGGPGKGWLRLVRTPGEARRAIAGGKLAVVIGVESSFPLGCRAERRARCTRAQVDERLDRLHRLGVRSLFIAHWADNGFAGAAVEGGPKGKFINAMQRVETGRWSDVGRCPERGQGEEMETISQLEVDVLSDVFPATRPLRKAKLPKYPRGKRCNERGLTPLGRHLVRRMMRTGMLVETDHMSERARREVLAIAARERTPVVSGHNHTGGTWTTRELRRLSAVGGVASQTLEPTAELAREIVDRRRYRPGRGFFGVGLGTDAGGFATLPGPPADAATSPLTYPFRIAGGTVSFDRQRTGERTFDFNADGMAHYGLLPDLLADMARRPRGREATDLLFRSAEAYLRMWEAADRRRAASR